MEETLKRIYDYSLEEIMGERFGQYAKTIIQDRAIPDVRDGLKPVQRRILYTMYKDKYTYDKPYHKCAKTIGNVMGQFHPHGDSSIYEAMIRMSQWWKQSTPYLDIHGNNGSMDGDSPAAYRYTEARLAKISNEMLRDIDKDTVIWTPNYDDELLEPTVLPSRFPNLLVNGSNGISAGYATNIPPHNLGEVIDATIKRIDSPNCYLDTILEIVKGPDFPTGGIVEGIRGIRDAYTTGRGRIIVRSKISFEKVKGKDQIVITEIPFDVNKASLVKRIDEIRLDKKVEGISEVRDESDRENPVRIVIDLKKDANQDLVYHYLLKNTDLQISYNFNMVAIVNRRPMTLGILPILDAYIKHQEEIVTKRTQFDLNHAKYRMHIVEGLIKALSILDDIIKTIRSSKDRSDAIANLVQGYDFTEEQAKAIVVLQLYKLTNTDVTALKEEHHNLELAIQFLQSILDDENKLKDVIKKELREIKKEYATERKTVIKEEITEIKIDTTEMIPKEDVVVVVTKEGYVKRVSERSYNSSKEEMTTLKEGDYVTGLYRMNTTDTLLLFTDKGNYLYIPVYELPDLKWKELGKHVSNIIKLKSEEMVISSIPVNDFDASIVITTVTKNGMIKRSPLSDYRVQRYSKPMVSMKLKEGDSVIVNLISNDPFIFLTTQNGYSLYFNIEEVGITGIRSSGVKAIALKNDIVVGANFFHDSKETITIFTDKRTGKRIHLSEFEPLSRGRKGILSIRDVKTNPYHITNVFIGCVKDEFVVMTKQEALTIKNTDLPIADRYSVGSTITKEPVLAIYPKQTLQNNVQITLLDSDSENEALEDEISLKEIDDRIMTIDDFLDNFES